MQKEVNLESIILEAYGCKDVHELQRDFDVSVQMIKEIAIEACKQVLEFAAENAKVSTSLHLISKSGDFDVIRNINKQSILDTINQIK